MTVGEDQNKNRYKNWQLCSIWKFPLCDHGTIKLAHNYVCFINPWINLLMFCLRSLVYTTTRYLNFSTYCSVMPLSVHCLGFVERHNTSVFLVLIFNPARSHVPNNRSSACWKSCSDDASSTKLFAKSKRLILQLPIVTLSSTRLWLSIQFIHTMKMRGRQTNAKREFWSKIRDILL